VLRGKFAYDMRHAYHANIARNKGCYFWTPMYVRVRNLSVEISLYFIATRLANFYISVDDAFPSTGVPYYASPSRVCYNQITAMKPGETRYFLCKQKVFGQYVVVSLVTNAQYLTLCEVRVYVAGRPQ
jgi:hypothetical protein